MNWPMSLARLRRRAWLAAAWLAASGSVGAESPFRVEVLPTEVDGEPAIEVRVDVPTRHRLYADQLKVEGPGGVALRPLRVPEPRSSIDPNSGQSHPFFDVSFTALYAVARTPGAPLQVAVEWLGCDDTVCFLPERREWRLGGEGPSTAAAGPAGSSSIVLPPDYVIARQAFGYQGEAAFLDFLAGRGRTAGLLDRGWLVGILLILGGGLLLNFTPCVLPMIPINLAIIGAGVRASSRSRGLAMGGIYGAGMCVAYGLLGVAVIRSGATFGALNASPWFNGAIAVLFAALSLAMFGVVPIDFTRLQGRVGSPAALRNRYLAAFAMGAVAALLAGACVAPVLVSVLLLSVTLYQQGHTAALLLPFLLGLGMALPWPLAGAGMARLPRPGRWMDWVKYAFGVFIAAVAVYYGRLAWTGAVGARSAADGAHTAAGWAAYQLAPDASETEWSAVFAAARRRGVPIFLDVWASWCKNCHAMEASTLRRPAVRAALANMVTLRYQAERPSDPATAAVLNQFGVKGLPTYLILEQRASAR